MNVRCDPPDQANTTTCVEYMAQYMSMTPPSLHPPSPLPLSYSDFFTPPDTHYQLILFAFAFLFPLLIQGSCDLGSTTREEQYLARGIGVDAASLPMPNGHAPGALKFFSFQR